jgi:predicted TIM-barrel fold metal-dependent hydrolase
LPADFVRFANEFPEVTLILAHLGNSGVTADSPDLQVRAIQASRHGNVYVDTSSAQSLLPGLVEWAVHEIGPERILFGSDTPLYFAASQRARIDDAEIGDNEKRKILLENAQRVFPSLAVSA